MKKIIDMMKKKMPKTPPIDFETLNEIHITKPIGKDFTEKQKEKTADLLEIPKEEVKLAGIRFEFVTKQGILCEYGLRSKEFNPEEWD